MNGSIAPVFLKGVLLTLWILPSTRSQAEEPITVQPPQNIQETRLPAEFWALYEELADEAGQLPAPDELPQAQSTSINQALHPLDALEAP